jgi:PAS domain S-box-containing protein
MNLANFSRWPLSRRLRWFLLACGVLTLTAGAVYAFLRPAMEADARDKAEMEMKALAPRVDDFIERAISLAHAIALQQEALAGTTQVLNRDVLQVLLDVLPEQVCQGVYVAFENLPYDDPMAVRWVQRNPHGRTQLGYDYHDESKPQCQWYHGAKKQRKGGYYVTDPYFDEGGADRPLVSVTTPLFYGEEFAGVAGVDLDLHELYKLLQSLSGDASPLDDSRATLAGDAPATGKDDDYYYLVSNHQRVFAHPALHDNSQTAYFELAQLPEAELLINSQDGTLAPVNEPNTGSRRLICWKMLGKSHWKLIRSVAESEVFWPVRKSLFQILGLLALILASMVGGFAYLNQVSLVRRERYYRALIDNATDIVTILGRDGVILYKSPSVRKILGYLPEELVGRAVSELIHPDDMPAINAVIEKMAAGPATSGSAEYRMRHKDGHYRTLEGYCTDLIADPVVGGIVVNSRDITDRKQREEEIHELNAELEARVRLRTAELEQKNEELHSAKDATEQAMRQQEIFLSNVAHDLRTPLTIVIGYSEDLLRKAKRKGMDAFVPDLKLITNRGKDLLELINDLLNLSKAMNDRGIELEREEFDVGSLVNSRMEGIGAIARKYGNTVEFHPQDGLGTMIGDRAKVWRILMNLLTNACKFTKDGTITLTARRVAAAEGDAIEFKVADTGIGMNPEKQTRLFDRFSQVHATNGKMQDGVGLGLSICLLYCKAMGGSISVQSEEGHGSTFTVVLPAGVPLTYRGDQHSTAPEPSGQLMPAAPTSETSGVSRPTVDEMTTNLVLIIDDDASVCELMERNLSQEGIRTRAAHSGEEGLRLAKELLPSAIILDVIMPGIDGWAVLAALKTDSQTSQIPIIMATMLDERERGLKMGADEYITKPFARDRLSELIHRHLGNHVRARILVVEDDADTRSRLCGSLREQEWEVWEAGDGVEALAILRHHAPDLVLLDLMLPRVNGFEVLKEIRSDERLHTIPVVVMTAAELSTEDRRRLQGQVEQILQKGLYSRDELLSEMRVLVREHQGHHFHSSEESSHAQDPVHRG